MKVGIFGECSGVIRDAFLRRGHDAMSCDLKPTEVLGPHYQGDMFDLFDYPWDLAIVHIPCTNTSVSGARWFKEKRMDGRQQASVAMFMRAWRACKHIRMIAFEHPVSIISTLFRKPDQTIHPHQFWHLGERGRGEVKATCLYTRNLPLLAPTTPDEPGRHPACWLMPPSDNRATDRARTDIGVGDAMAEQWGKYATQGIDRGTTENSELAAQPFA